MANPYEYRGRGEGFLDDYSPLAGVASAVQGFSEAFERAQDRQQKRLEQNAQIEALKAKTDREKFQSQMDQAKAGVKFGQNGEMQDAPIPLRFRIDEDLKAGGEGYRVKRDDSGGYLGLEADPNSPKMVAAKSQADARTIRFDQSDDTKDRREHEKVLGRLNSNPAAKQKLQQSQGLDNALSIITQSDHITPEQIHEFQQAIRGNMGMKGSSGVGEREETYFKSLGLNAARWKEFLTGEPASIAKDSKLIEHFRQLASIEQGNIKKQYEKALGAASGGHASMYARRPDLRADLDDAIRAQQSQFGDDSQAAPQGLVPRGLVPAGKVGAAPATQQHPQDQQAVTWASGVIANPKASAQERAMAAQIFKTNGLDENGRRP